MKQNRIAYTPHSPVDSATWRLNQGNRPSGKMFFQTSYLCSNGGKLSCRWLPRHSSHLHTLLKTRKMLTTFKLTSKCCHQPDWLTNRLTDWMTGWLTMAKEGCRGGWDSDADGAFPVEQHAVAFSVAADRCVGGNRRYMGLVLGVINIFDN